MKHKIPAYYKAPLKSRADIAAFLFRQQSYGGYSRGEGCRFVWDVKLRNLNLEYNHLLAIHKESGYCGLDQIDHPEVQRLYRKRYDELMKGYELEDWAREDACRQLDDTDCWNHYWDGTKLAVSFGWYGRSGGYLGLKSFGWFDFTKESTEYWNLVFRGNPFRKGTDAWEQWDGDYDSMDYETLRLLYKVIIMYNHDFTREAACKEVEYQAAYALFASHEDEIEEEWAGIVRDDINLAGYAIMEELLHAA